VTVKHNLRDEKWGSNIFGVRFFVEAECDIDGYLVVGKLRERLSVSNVAEDMP
jgi:hypothetical protein